MHLNTNIFVSKVIFRPNANTFTLYMPYNSHIVSKTCNCFVPQPNCEKDCSIIIKIVSLSRFQKKFALQTVCDIKLKQDPSFSLLGHGPRQLAVLPTSCGLHGMKKATFENKNGQICLVLVVRFSF